MKTRISLLVAYLAFMGFTKPADAEITKSASALQNSTRVKDLETILRKSGLCQHYPNIVKISKNNTAEISTYVDRQLPDKDIKLLALNMAKLISTNVKELTQIKVRLYDPASTKFWKDIVLSSAQIENGLKSGPAQEQVLNSIKIINNMGLLSGPNLEFRVEIYKRILELQHKGVPVQSYLDKLRQIDVADKSRQNISTQLNELISALTNAESTIDKPITTEDKSTALINSLEQAWQQAKDNEASARQDLEEAEQERQSINIPEAYDMDGQARFANNTQALQAKIDADLATWHQAVHDRDAAYTALHRAKEESL